MTAFVLGATGFVGREVVRQLAVRATPVVAHLRPDSRSLEEWKQKLGALGAVIDTTTWDPAALAAALDRHGADQLYILIGTTRGKAKADAVEGDIYEKVDYGLTKIAVEAAQHSKSKPRLVYLSGIGASVTARSAYLRARGRAEDAVRGSRLPWVMARPAIITGARDESRVGERMGAVVGDGLLAVAGLFAKSLAQKYASTTPDILASALIRIGEAPEHDRVFAGADLR
jgi:uncharacterized protein YbjT (DUF2867 family)